MTRPSVVSRAACGLAGKYTRDRRREKMRVFATARWGRWASRTEATRPTPDDGQGLACAADLARKLNVIGHCESLRAGLQSRSIGCGAEYDANHDRDVQRHCSAIGDCAVKKNWLTNRRRKIIALLALSL